MFVVDTSVIVKWFVQEDQHNDALAILEGEELICPDFALVETANVLWRKVRKSEIDADQMNSAIAELPAFFDRVLAAASYLSTAKNLAQQLEHSVYDCMFLAIALQIDGAQLITADYQFLSKCVEHGYADKLKPLGNKPVFLDMDDPKVDQLLKVLASYILTRENVLGNIPSKDIGDGFKVRPSADFRMALDSPAMKRLKMAISDLSPEEAQSIIAICWYGRGYGSNGFEYDFSNAANLASDPAQHAPYISGLLQYYETGLQKLRFERPELLNDG